MKTIASFYVPSIANINTNFDSLQLNIVNCWLLLYLISFLKKEKKMRT